MQQCSGREGNHKFVTVNNGVLGMGRKEGEGQGEREREGGRKGRMLVSGLAWNLFEIVRGSLVAGSRPGDWPAEPFCRAPAVWTQTSGGLC